jgi:ferredoxin-NADP reductase
MEEVVTIKSISNVTHNVKRFQVEKPYGYDFNPGQATEVAINKDKWRDEKRPFTFTSLSDAPYLEFTIKIYNDHPGVTNELDSLTIGDELIVSDVWGAIEYKGAGYFIAGGAGITPFIAILRQLHKENNLEGNKLIFSNRTENDIILEGELTSMLGENAIYTVTDGTTNKYYQGHINEEFLKRHIEDFSKHFYLCGPPKMVEALEDCLVKLGASPEAVVFEK